LLTQVKQLQSMIFRAARLIIATPHSVTIADKRILTLLKT
jgi:hypothetical protein